jgi:hypothetical protein
MTFIGSIATKASSRKHVYSTEALIEGSGGIYEINTGCRETLCTNLTYGNNLINKLLHHNGFLKLTLEFSGVNSEIVPCLNEFVLKSRVTKENAPFTYRNGWIIFNKSSFCSLPLVSTVALLLNWYNAPFTIDHVIREVLYGYDEMFENPLDSLFTAYFLWATEYKNMSHTWYIGSGYSGPASFIPANFFWHMDWHKQFYQEYHSDIDYLDDELDLDLSNDYWKIIGRK